MLGIRAGDGGFHIKAAGLVGERSYFATYAGGSCASYPTGTQLRFLASGATSHEWPPEILANLLNLQTGEDKRLTFQPSFDGFPSISPDGKLLAFSSSREAKPGKRSLSLYLMDITPLKLGRRN